MPARRGPVYEERTPWPGWVHVVLWGALGLAAVGVAAADSEPLEERLVGAAAILGVGALLQWLLGGMAVRLYPDGMVVGFGGPLLIRKRIAYEDILRMDVVHYSPLREFGGWGYRIAPGKRAWTARGDEAVVLHLTEGPVLYIGSDRPGRLRERILAVGGTRIGSARRGYPGA